MHLRTLISLAALLIASFANGQADHPLYTAYPKYRTEGFETKRFKPADVYRELGRYASVGHVHMEEAGRSMGGQPIYLVKTGNGSRKILLWSQMHGNESTATMALMDILRFLVAGEGFDAYRQAILDNTTIYMIPLLNPDGGDRFERRNNLGIDLNRDAVRLQTPEAQVLMETRNRIGADFGFNLHDQNRWSGVGNTCKPASISFLAPAYNEDKDMNERRKDAMRVISVMIDAINPHIPGQIGKYSDEFEPRAFGDNFQKSGTRTILIESGYTYNDDEKQELRRINFVAILEALQSIATGTYNNKSTENYMNLPFNKGNMADLVIRNLDYELDGHNYLLDIAFRRDEINTKKGNVIYNRVISDIGDLSTTCGYVDFDAAGYRIEWGRQKPETYTSPGELSVKQIEDAVRVGMHTFLVQDPGTLYDLDPDVPYRFRTPQDQKPNGLNYRADPAFYLVKDNHLAYLVVNGKLWKIGRAGIDAVKEGPAK